MKMSIKHSQQPSMIGGAKFALFTRFELDEEENRLVQTYRMYDAVLVAGDNERAMTLAYRLAMPLALVAAGLSVLAGSFGGFEAMVARPIVVFGLAYAIAGYAIYHSLREDVQVRDVLHGRTFKARDVLALVELEAKLQAVAVAFRHLLDLMKHWNEAKVWTIEPGAEPRLLVVEPPRAAA